MNARNIGASDAVSLPQPEPLEKPPFASRRW